MVKPRLETRLWTVMQRISVRFQTLRRAETRPEGRAALAGVTVSSGPGRGAPRKRCVIHPGGPEGRERRQAHSLSHPAARRELINQSPHWTRAPGAVALPGDGNSEAAGAFVAVPATGLSLRRPRCRLAVVAATDWWAYRPSKTANAASILELSPVALSSSMRPRMTARARVAWAWAATSSGQDGLSSSVNWGSQSCTLARPKFGNRSGWV